MSRRASARDRAFVQRGERLCLALELAYEVHGEAQWRAGEGYTGAVVLASGRILDAQTVARMTGDGERDHALKLADFQAQASAAPGRLRTQAQGAG